MTLKKINKSEMEEVVISGISGAFPNCENIAEFKENLFAGNDMTSFVNRWTTDIDENKQIKMGTLKTLDRFDYSFFRLHHAHAEEMPVGCRLLMEKTFEAIIDAGYNPEQLKGKNVAVICGVCESGIKKLTSANETIATLATSKFMLSNRISYWLDVHGPSFTLETDTSSSLYALDYAYKFIRNGACESAIVCVPNLCFQPASDIYEIDLLSPEGICRPFDADANGFTRAEAIVVVFLQKKKDARRIYANVVHTATNSGGFKPEGISHFSCEQQKDLYEKFYNGIDIDPSSIAYLETHGIGTQIGDAAEGNSIEEFFCANRKRPLKIGSINSNMGYSEAASGLCSLAKLIVSFESKMIPANLNYKNPNPNIKGLQNGNLQVVTEPTPLEGEYFAINSFGFGGANGHILLTPHDKLKNAEDTSIDDELPRLVTVSGRTEEAVDCILNDLEKNHADREYIRLMHEIFSEDISGHIQRGYILLHKDKENVKSKKFVSGETRPIWFIFAGMGSQWPAMGKSLMKIPIFENSIQKSHDILQTKGMNLIEIITKDDSKMFDNILNSFVGIAAIQIALVDVLRALDIKPDKIIGHSVGELGCAYADECFTAEQMILAAYYRGLVSLETEFVHGTMAAVGKGYNDLKDILHPDIDIACHNSSTSCTISGPTDKMQDFIKELKEKNIFVREVNTSNIAYHSRYIASAAPKFISYLETIIPEPKLRSDKWICTSAPEEEWNSEKAKYCSAEYHTNNLLNAVYFEEGSTQIPSNAIAIEIAPHGLLNAILKRSLPATVENIPLTLKNHENGVEFFLNALGLVYQAGCNPKLGKLYPAVEFPVSTSTPMISPLIKWQHEEQWETGMDDSKNSIRGEQEISVNFQKDRYLYLKDHIIDGRNMYPSLGYLEMVWEMVAKMQKRKPEAISVVFENVRFGRIINVSKKGIIKFHVTVHVGTNNFEVTQNGVVVASGFVRTSETINKEMVVVSPFETQTSTTNDSTLNTEDFYKELESRGYHYKGLFKKVITVNFEGTKGKALWSNNFVTFMNAMTQIMALNANCRQPLIPAFIRKIVIDVNKHSELLQTLEEKTPEIPIDFHPNLDLLCAGGIQMCGWRNKEVTRRSSRRDLLLEQYDFVPYINDKEVNINSAIRICVHIALENIHSKQVKTYEIYNHQNKHEDLLISNVIGETLAELPEIQVDINLLMTKARNTEETDFQISHHVKVSTGELPRDNSCSIIIIPKMQYSLEFFDKVFCALKANGFIIAKITSNDISHLEKQEFSVCFSRSINAGERIVLLNKICKDEYTSKSIELNNSRHWLREVRNVLNSIEAERKEELIVYAEKESQHDILEFFDGLRMQDKGSLMRCFIIMDKKAPPFSLENVFYKSQLDKNLSHNVYKNGQWGSYRYLRFHLNKNYTVNHASCVLEKCADLSSLTWTEDSCENSTCNDSSGKSQVHVYYSGVNFHDIMTSVGIIPPLNISQSAGLNGGYQGIEYSGKDANGRRLMGMVQNKALSTMVETLPTHTWTVPETMSLEEAATIPVAYCTAIWAFLFKIKLQKGDSVLIHTGNGDIGQAAINICLQYECNIFTTVDDPKKEAFIRNNFPQIPESHICNITNTSFEKFIMEQTNGEGVDVVLNNLCNAQLQASIRCVGRSGHFLEVGKLDMFQNNPLELGHFLNDITFHCIHLDEIISTQNGVMSKLHKKLQIMLDQGIIKPLQRIVFPAHKIQTAFRYAAAEKHSGKVVIKIRDEEKNLKAKPNSICIEAKPRVICKRNKSYVIIGDFNGFSFELTDWLISHEAQNIILCSLRGISKDYQSYKIKQWRSQGINVAISNEDTTKETGVKNLLHAANSLGSIDGIFTIAMTFEGDSTIYRSTQDINPKETAVLHLDKQSRILCKNLEYFVIFMATSYEHGNQNQPNYNLGISLVKRICESRKTDNLPALAIQWKTTKKTEEIAESVKEYIPVVVGETVQQNMKLQLDALDYLLKQPNHFVATTTTKKYIADFNVENYITNILGIENLKTTNHTPMTELGLNFILATELRQILESKFNICLTQEDLQNMTFVKLHELIEDKGIENLKTMNRAPMTQLGLNFVVATELRQILESKFNICLTLEDLQNMTFVQLHELIEEKGGESEFLTHFQKHSNI